MITVRPIVESDLPRTLAWRNDDASRRWFHSQGEISWDDHLAWFLGRPESDWMFIVESDGEPVAQFGIYDIYGRAAQFGRLLVAPERRGEGFGRAAVSAAVAIAADAGLKSLYLEVKDDNTAAVSLYRSVGFTDTTGAAGSTRMELAL